jgi:hypothetical protein
MLASVRAVAKVAGPLTGAVAEVVTDPLTPCDSLVACAVLPAAALVRVAVAFAVSLPEPKPPVALAVDEPEPRWR